MAAKKADREKQLEDENRKLAQEIISLKAKNKELLDTIYRQTTKEGKIGIDERGFY